MADRSSAQLTLPARVVIFLLYVVGAYSLHVAVTGVWGPGPGGESLWLLSAVGLLSFRLFAARHFVHPQDSFATSVTGLFVLWAVDLSEATVALDFLSGLRDWTALFLAVVAVAGGAAILLKDIEPTEHPHLERLRSTSYWFNVTFGTGEIVFTIPALLGIFAFHPWELVTASALTAGWVILAAVEPLEAVTRFILTTLQDDDFPLVAGRIGTIQRIDTPNILRVSLDDADSWGDGKVHIAKLPDGDTVQVLPLFSQVHDEGLLGTGLILERSIDNSNGGPRLQNGSVFELESAPDRQTAVSQLYGFDGEAELVGFTVEGSQIGSVKFEAASDHPLNKGNVIFCEQRDRTIFYQINAVEASEESFDRNPLGRQIVTATQLGYPKEEGGFQWYSWAPEMNTPVFVPTKEELRGEVADQDQEEEDEESLVLGQVPETNINIKADFDSLAGYHTAVLGTTGMGKTELVFDIIRHGLDRGTHTVCIDFTGEYRPRLQDKDPQILGFDDDQIEELHEHVQAIETDKFGGREQKEDLYQYIDEELKPEVREEVNTFLSDEGGNLGIFALEEIANTRATLRATELYISELFRWAREHRGARQILLAVEEAHTIIPEMNVFGYDKSDTQAVVGRMSQIALQGRKYGVGLLLVSQRTALVRKTILSQCNTYICFSLVDQTSLKYLSNVLGPTHGKMVPTLEPREIIVSGKGIDADRPVMAEIPYDPAKEEASEELDAFGREIDGENEDDPEMDDRAEGEAGLLDEEDDLPF